MKVHPRRTRRRFLREKYRQMCNPWTEKLQKPRRKRLSNGRVIQIRERHHVLIDEGFNLASVFPRVRLQSCENTREDTSASILAFPLGSSRISSPELLSRFSKYLRSSRCSTFSFPVPRIVYHRESCVPSAIIFQINRQIEHSFAYARASTFSNLFRVTIFCQMFLYIHKQLIDYYVNIVMQVESYNLFVRNNFTFSKKNEIFRSKNCTIVKAKYDLSECRN